MARLQNAKRANLHNRLTGIRRRKHCAAEERTGMGLSRFPSLAISIEGAEVG